MEHRFRFLKDKSVHVSEVYLKNLLLHDPERDPVTGQKFVSDLEREFSSLQGDWMRSVELRDRIGEIVTGSDFPDLPPDLQGRLDLLHVELVALTRENVCTNERCPYYKKSCKMR